MKLWKGRFSTRLNPEALRFSSSLEIDKRLYEEDIEGSLAHVAMLARQHIIQARDARTIQQALRAIRREIKSGRLSMTPRDGQRYAAEDVHMAIENRLTQKIGERGGMLHTARSRNDQIALDERLYMRKAIQSLAKRVRHLQRTLHAKAKRTSDVVMPGYTHLQRGQPVLLAHHLLAYVDMLERDRERLHDCLLRVERSPLGASALGGTSYKIDPQFTAKKLGFPGIIENSIDAVSDRDVHIEFLSACAIIMMHLSRLSEELVLWSSHEWRFAEIGENLTTGSSIMPQKKNPDMAELVRGKTGRVYGDLLALLTIMKGLPLAYNRDMQEDKEPLFDAADTTESCLRITSLMMKSIRFRRDRFDAELNTDFLLATELADYLARKGMPFREAHSIVGGIVRTCTKRNIALREFSLEEYRRHSALFHDDLYKELDARASLGRKKSAGSTSPREVAKALKAWEKRLRS